MQLVGDNFIKREVFQCYKLTFGYNNALTLFLLLFLFHFPYSPQKRLKKRT